MYIFFYKPFHATSYIYTHIFWKASFATNSQIHIFWKTLLCYPSKHFVRHFMLYIFILCKAFSYYIYSYFARYFIQHIYIHTYYRRVFSCYLSARHSSWDSKLWILVKKLLKHMLILMHLLHSKPETWIPRHESSFWHFSLASTNYPHTHNSHNLFCKLSSTKSCANAIEAFHWTLGGRMFKHGNQGNGGNVACPIISECTLGLRPYPTTP